MLPHRSPIITYNNPGNETKIIYLIVDDPGWMSQKKNPYTLEIARSWDPSLHTDTVGKAVSGIWGYERSVSAQFRRPTRVMPGFK